jgi:hypothetical protein
MVWCYPGLFVEVVVLVAVPNEDQEARQEASLTGFLPSFLPDRVRRFEPRSSVLTFPLALSFPPLLPLGS